MWALQSLLSGFLRRCGGVMDSWPGGVGEVLGIWARVCGRLGLRMCHNDSHRVCNGTLMDLIHSPPLAVRAHRC